MRYVGAAFLSVWLAGWAIGEVFALGFLTMLVRSILGSAIGSPRPVPGGDWITGGAAALAFVFLLFWLTMWTFGGIAAITQLLRSVAGEDQLTIVSGGVELMRRAGPFRRTKTFDRSAIHRVRVRRHDKAVVFDTASGTQVITQFGSPEDRQSIADWLRRQLSIPEDTTRTNLDAAPANWTMTVEGGSVRLSQTDPRTRRTTAIIAWGIVAIVALAWVGALQTGNEGSIPGFIVTLLLAFGAAWVTWARREWIAQPGQLTSYKRFLTWQSERTFRSARLEVAESRDSDNDEHYKLTVGDESGRKTIYSRMRT